MLETHRASCHCERVVVEARLDPTQPGYRCNCSICRCNRFWPAVALPDGFHLLSDGDELTRCVFGGGRNEHFFCRHRGVRVFDVGNDTPTGRMYGVNIGCLEDVPEQVLAKMPIARVGGMHDRWDAEPEFSGHLRLLRGRHAAIKKESMFTHASQPLPVKPKPAMAVACR